MLSQLMSREAPQKDQSRNFWSDSWLLVDEDSVWDSLGTLQRKQCRQMDSHWCQVQKPTTMRARFQVVPNSKISATMNQIEAACRAYGIRHQPLESSLEEGTSFLQFTAPEERAS